MRLHVCWGNYEGPHTHDVAFADIQPLLYEAHVGALVLSMANARHAHEHHCFERQPAARRTWCSSPASSTPPTTSSSTPRSSPTGSWRSPARSAIPRRIIAGTDCGFDTSAGIGDVAPSVVWEKLRALRAGADLASERLL